MDQDYSLLKGYLDKEGKFSKLPGKKQKKKQSLMLQFLANKFEKDKKYTEKEVNELLNKHHSFNDPASLRRMMLGGNLIDRTIDGKEYWLP